jgi:hypothetical protein
MANSRVDQLQQQFVSLMAMFEGMMNKSDELMKMMERMEKKLDSLLSKKLDEQKKWSLMPSASTNSVTPIHLVTVGKPSNQNPKASNSTAWHQWSITCHDQNGADSATPIGCAATLGYLCKEPMTSASWSHIDCEATLVTDPFT